VVGSVNRAFGTLDPEILHFQPIGPSYLDSCFLLIFDFWPTATLPSSLVRKSYGSSAALAHFIRFVFQLLSAAQNELNLFFTTIHYRKIQMRLMSGIVKILPQHPPQPEMSPKLTQACLVGSNAISAFLSWRLQATTSCDVTLVWKSGFESVSQYGVSFKYASS
jgi:hypothetical protein